MVGHCPKFVSWIGKVLISLISQELLQQEISFLSDALKISLKFDIIKRQNVIITTKLLNKLITITWTSFYVYTFNTPLAYKWTKHIDYIYECTAVNSRHAHTQTADLIFLFSLFLW